MAHASHRRVRDGRNVFKYYLVSSYLSGVRKLQHGLQLLPNGVLEDDDRMLTRSILET